MLRRTLILDGGWRSGAHELHRVHRPKLTRGSTSAQAAGIIAATHAATNAACCQRLTRWIPTAAGTAIIDQPEAHAPQRHRLRAPARTAACQARRQDALRTRSWRRRPPAPRGRWASTPRYTSGSLAPATLRVAVAGTSLPADEHDHRSQRRLGDPAPVGGGGRGDQHEGRAQTDERQRPRPAAGPAGAVPAPVARHPDPDRGHADPQQACRLGEVPERGHAQHRAGGQRGQRPKPGQRRPGARPAAATTGVGIDREGGQHEQRRWWPRRRVSAPAG